LRSSFGVKPTWLRSMNIADCRSLKAEVKRKLMTSAHYELPGHFLRL
jgi:hypothetical protein